MDNTTNINSVLTQMLSQEWRTTGYGPKEYGIYLSNKRGYSHKRTNRKNKK